tara:strand:- start:133 stop:492 length:360 start_codon:yes stop_codon:yes gene_type:complete
MHNEDLLNYNTNTVANIAHEPDCLSVTSIPKDHKPVVEKFLKDEWDKLDIKIRSRYFTQNWQTVIDYMNARDTYDPGRLSEHLNSTLSFAKSKILEHIPLVNWIYEQDKYHDRWYNGKD